MLRRLSMFTLAVAFAVALSPNTTQAMDCKVPGLCDDIATIADGWAEVANALEENAGDDIEDLNIEALSEDVQTLYEPTKLLAEALLELGSDEEAEMGEVLAGLMADLEDVEGDDMAAYLVDIMDDITSVMDFIVDYCDEQ